MATTSFRQTFRSGMKTVLDTYKTANPTLLSHVYDHEPPQPRTPCAFVNKEISETLAFSGQVRQRVMTGTVTVLNRLMSQNQAADEQDVLVDGLLDAFSTAGATGTRAAGSGSVMLPSAVGDEERSYGEGAGQTAYAGFNLTITLAVQEGRAI
jgi:hypothetical protein